ncbi:MAG: isochorismatase family protein [Planctomycetes bacterium]|nr:isochorismatase family protein [Planctomycetota bacterium]
MITRSNAPEFEFVVVDMNTQTDFCSISGAHPVSNRESLIPALRRVIAWTKRNGVPIVSSVDSHRVRDIRRSDFPPCCVDGSNGQTKVGFTILPRSARVEVDNTLSVPLNLFSTFQQLLFRMRDGDLLSNPKADRFLTQLPTARFLVIGNVLEQAVKTLVLGLLTRHKDVAVIADACGYWNEPTGDLAIRQMVVKGATVISVDDLLLNKLTERRRYRRPWKNGKNGHSANGKISRGPSRSVGLRVDQLPSTVQAVRMSRRNGYGHPNRP